MTWLIYGANGYTGKLLSETAVARGEQPILAGRNASRIAPMATSLGLEHRRSRRVPFPRGERTAVVAIPWGDDILAGDVSPGAHTAATALGSGYVRELDGIRIHEPVLNKS